MAALIVLGTSSWAGKSLVATALCRWFARQGVSVAPFKAQNMSNNARVAAGGELGAAQYWQALAAGVEPDVRMNPVLVKPEADDRSQVIVCGTVDHELSRADWRRRAPAARPAVAAALGSLLDDFELVLVEGAGSPAEINLTAGDLSNRYVTELTGASNLLVSDISRGGALAHLFGTWKLMPSAISARTGGFILNRFRGDPALLDPAPAELESMTGVPTVGVLPELAHRLPDEDGVAWRPSRAAGPRVAVVRYPTASNLDEFRVLEDAAEVVWARRPADLAGADLVVLPGSKEPLRDLAWLRSSGMAGATAAAARDGLRVLGICGGLQLLGRAVGGEAALGLLPVETAFAEDKLVRRRTARFADLAEPWRALSRRAVAGYEIRQGRSGCDPDAVAALSDGLGFVQGNVLGVYLHGLLEDPGVVEALTGARPQRSLEAVFDQLADAVDRALDMPRIRALAGLGPQAAPQPPQSSLVLLTGGARSGKSALAVRAAAQSGRHVVFIATAEPGDAEFAERIERHRSERPPGWEVVEEPAALETALRDAAADACVVVDCLTLWTANLLQRGLSDDAVVGAAARAARAAAERPGPTIAVTNEVGSGVVPEAPLGRRYRDLLGHVNRAWAEVADRAALVVAGRVLELRRFVL